MKKNVDIDIKKLYRKGTYKKNTNINKAEYFVNQAEEMLFCIYNSDDEVVIPKVDYKEMRVKEEILKQYCKKKDYKITKIVYDDEPFSWEFMSYPIRNILNETYPCEYSKLITCDIKDLACTKKQLIAINQLINDGEAEIETINQGVLNDDVLLDVCIIYNIFNKEELKELKVFYDEDGNISILDPKKKKEQEDYPF